MRKKRQNGPPTTPASTPTLGIRIGKKEKKPRTKQDQTPTQDSTKSETNTDPNHKAKPDQTPTRDKTKQDQGKTKPNSKPKQDKPNKKSQCERETRTTPLLFFLVFCFQVFFRVFCFQFFLGVFFFLHTLAGAKHGPTPANTKTDSSLDVDPSQIKTFFPGELLDVLHKGVPSGTARPVRSAEDAVLEDLEHEIGG